MKYALLCLIAIAMTGCDEELPTSPMAADKWNLYFNAYTITQHPTQVGEGWYFDFPNMKDSPYYIGYVETRHVDNLLAKPSVTMKLKVTADQGAEFRCDTGDRVHTDPCYVRALIKHDITFDWMNEYHRWWSNPIAYKLEAGTATVTTPLTPDQWTSMYGKRGTEALDEWKDCMEHTGWIGMTFGGGGSFGHGVYVPQGKARFTLLDYKVN